MADGSTIQNLETALAGDSRETKIKAVLAVPDDATGAIPVLEEALGKAEPELEVTILDALYRLCEDPQVEPRLREILESPEAEGDDGEALYMMARTVFERIRSKSAEEVLAEGKAVITAGIAEVDRPDEMALVIHGTWAKDGVWWRPGGDFHTYLLEDKGLDHLYSGDEFFTWSGRNVDGDRQDAARALGTWVAQHKPRKLDVYAHSHGANVAMLATRLGLAIRKLVMMSPPVRRDYFARWEKVQEAYNIQTRFDHVVAIARGRRWFPEDIAKVKQKELNVKGHSTSHKPEVWEENDVPAFVGIA